MFASAAVTDPSIIVALVAACGSIAAVVVTARVARRGQDRAADNEYTRLNFDVWRESVDELRTQVEELRDEVDVCHADKDQLTRELAGVNDELDGMKAGNRALRMRVTALEDQVEAATGHKIGGADVDAS